MVSVRVHCSEKWRTSFHTDVLSYLSISLYGIHPHEYYVPGSPQHALKVRI